MEKIEAIIRWGRYAADHALLSAKSGNLSVRDGDGIRITGSGTMLGELSPDDVIGVSLEGELVASVTGRRPSMETDMHRMLYRKVSDAGAVFHSSPPYATLLSCTTASIPRNLIPETMAYINDIVRIPYRHAGSPELAASVAERLGLGDVGLLENHGVIVVARTVEEAVNITETFEILCRMVVTARAAGLELKVLPESTRDDFLLHLARRGAYGRPAPLPVA